MSNPIHSHFLTIASSISPALKEAFVFVGGVELKRRRGSSLGVLLCRAVVGQQLSVLAARTIWGRVLERAGGERLMAFFVRVDTRALRKCGLSAVKAKAMKAIAQAALAGEIHGNALRRLGHEERAARLTGIYGVGQWTADMMNLFYFGDEDIWPESDVSVQKTFGRLIWPKRKVSEMAGRFAPYRSYLALYMWRWADSGPVA